MFKKTIVAAAFAATSIAGTTSNAAIFDLVFIMDESGSVGSGNFNAAMGSLATALENSLTQPVLDVDQYNISVVSFSDSNGNRTNPTGVDITVAPTLVSSV